MNIFIKSPYFTEYEKFFDSKDFSRPIEMFLY